jgi:hypothetical protein
VLLPLLFVTCNCFSYIDEEGTWTYSKHTSCDRCPASLLARRSDLQKTHVTLSLSTVVTSSRTRKTRLPILSRDLATDCLPRVCLRENLFTNTLPSNGCTFNSTLPIFTSGRFQHNAQCIRSSPHVLVKQNCHDPSLHNSAATADLLLPAIILLTFLHAQTRDQIIEVSLYKE